MAAIMNSSRSTAVLMLTVIVSLFLFFAEGANNCENEIIHRCISGYRELLKAKPRDKQHCSRVQEGSACFADNPSCSGESINRFRLYILQEVLLEVKLNICPKVDLKRLKDVVEKTGAAKGHTLVDTLDQDPRYNSCAAQVRLTCNKRFVDLMKATQRICGNSVEVFACYMKTARVQNCNSPIIQQFAKFLEKVGGRLVTDAFLANTCNDEL